MEHANKYIKKKMVHQSHTSWTSVSTLYDKAICTPFLLLQQSIKL